jgi:transposase
LNILDSCEHERGLGELADPAGADGDPLEGSPALGEQREAAFTAAAGGAVQGVIGLVVRGEDLPVGGLLDRCFDALADPGGSFATRRARCSMRAVLMAMILPAAGPSPSSRPQNGYVMSMQPVAWPEPDPLIAAAVKAMYGSRKTERPLAVAIRDRLGQWLADEDFAAAFGVRGKPGWPPSRLALVTILQRAEKLTDRLAAEAVRTRIDWKYLLGLAVDDPGFDHTVLTEFRAKVAQAGLEQVALDALLARLAADGLVKAGGKQRTDSTHVIAAVAALNRLELAGEAVRAAVEALAAAHPDWLAQRICVSDWTGRYATPMTAWRPPASQAKQDELAIAYARDGYALLEAVYDTSAPAWLWQLPAVDVLRRVLLQNYTRVITDGREVIKRRDKEPDGDGLPPGHARIASPYDLDARWGVKRDSFWLGYKLHVTETCDDQPRCGCPGDGGTGRRGHDKDCAAPAFPNLITHVATTDATVPDSQLTSVSDDELAGKTLAPGRHYLDSGYLSAALVVSEAARHGIALIGPLLADTSAQARAGKGYARADFAVDYDAKTVTCPQGSTSASWTPCTQNGKDAIVATFPPPTAAPARPAPCAPPGNAANSPCCPATWPKPRPPPAPRKRRSRSRPTTPAAPASKAPCTRPPATAPAEHATAVCPRPASTTYTWPARSTSSAWTPTGTAPR